MSNREFECPNCKDILSTKYTLSRHLKKCKPKESVILPQTSSTTSMFAQFMEKMQELENENKRLKDELEKRDEEINEVKAITIELPYDNDQLTKTFYKYNPYSRQYSIRRNGFVPKEFKFWYILKYFNIVEYPSTKVGYYKKCLEEILKNIPNEKLPYRVRDLKRRIYDIYDYSEKRWIKGNTDDLIQITIKKFVSLIHSSLFSAINVMSEINTLDFHALENRRIDPKSFDNLRANLRNDLIYNFTSPEYDDVTEEDKYNFYKNNFVKVLNERLSGEIEVEVNEDEFKEYEEIKEETKQEIKNKKPKQKMLLKKITLTYDNNDEEELNIPDVTTYYNDEDELNVPDIITDDNDDEGYETDTKENPYFDMHYDSS